MAEAGTYGGVSEIRLLYGLIVALVLTTFLGLAHSSLQTVWLCLLATRL